jgi:hypothetical protein
VAQTALKRGTSQGESRRPPQLCNFGKSEPKRKAAGRIKDLPFFTFKIVTMPKPPTIFLKPNEAKAVQMALGNMLETLQANDLQPWDPKARKDIAEMKEACRGAAAKIEKITGFSATLPPYIDGEEKDFFTKPS